MTFSLIGSAPKQGTINGTGNTTGFDTTGAKLLTIIVCDFATQPVSVISDTYSNIWVQRAQALNIVEGRLTLYECVNGTVGTGHQFAATGTGSAPALTVSAWGASGTPTADQTNSAFTSGSSVSTQQTGSITPTQANELLVYGTGDAWGTPLTVNVGTVLQSAGLVGGSSFAVGMAYEIQTTATTRNPTFSFVSTTQVEALIVSYIDAAGGVTGSAAWTEVQDTWAATGGIVGTGAAAWTEAPDLWAGTGTVTISGAAAWTEGPDIWAATGTITLPALTGTGAWTELPDIWSGTGNNGATSAGDNFLPLTRKQEQALRKRQRKDRLAQESLILERRLDSEAIDQDLRAAMRGQEMTLDAMVEAATVPEDDDEDADIELILLYH